MNTAPDSSEGVRELYWDRDLALPATKQTACSIAHLMAVLVAMERLLWLNLSGIKKKTMAFSWMPWFLLSGLFYDLVNAVVDRFQVIKKQSVAFREEQRASVQKSRF